MARVRPGAMQAHVPPEEPRISPWGDRVRSELPGPELVSEWGHEARALGPVEKGQRKTHSKIISIHSSRPFWSSGWEQAKQAQWQVEIKRSYYGTVKWCIHRDLLLFDRELFLVFVTSGRECKWWKLLLYSRLRWREKFSETTIYTHHLWPCLYTKSIHLFNKLC